MMIFGDFYPDDLFSPVIWVMESALDIRIYLLFDVQAKPRGGKICKAKCDAFTRVRRAKSQIIDP